MDRLGYRIRSTKTRPRVPSPGCFAKLIRYVYKKNQYYLIANLGYWVRSDRHGEGIATEATKLIALFGFQQLGLRRIEIVTGEENWASRRVAEKAGATYEGILRKRLKLGDKNIDAAMHSLIPEDLA